MINERAGQPNNEIRFLLEEVITHRSVIIGHTKYYSLTQPTWIHGGVYSGQWLGLPHTTVKSFLSCNTCSLACTYMRVPPRGMNSLYWLHWCICLRTLQDRQSISQLKVDSSSSAVKQRDDQSISMSEDGRTVRSWSHLTLERMPCCLLVKLHALHWIWCRHWLRFTLQHMVKAAWNLATQT